MKASPLSVPVLLGIGGTEINLGTLDLPMTVTTGEATQDPRGGMAVPAAIEVDMSGFHAGLAAVLREAADRIAGMESR